MEAKNFLKSKTLWVNVLTVLTLMAAHWGVDVDPELLGQLDTAVIALMPLINIGLRLVTKAPVKLN